VAGEYDSRSAPTVSIQSKGRPRRRRTTPAAAAAPVEPAGGLEPVIVEVQPPLDPGNRARLELQYGLRGTMNAAVTLGGRVATMRSTDILSGH
jgi:hypothetical protein